MTALGTVGGIGLVIGAGTGLGRGRLGLPRWRALLMAGLYPVLVFPLAGVAVYFLLAACGIHLFTPGERHAWLQAGLPFLIAGLVAAVPSTIAAFYAHVLAWNRHQARKLGSPTP